MIGPDHESYEYDGAKPDFRKKVQDSLLKMVRSKNMHERILRGSAPASFWTRRRVVFLHSKSTRELFFYIKLHVLYICVW